MDTVVAIVLGYAAVGWLVMLVMGLLDRDGMYYRGLVASVGFLWPFYLLLLCGSVAMDWIDAISRWVSRTRDAVVMCTGMLFRPYDIGREVAKWVSGVSSAQNAACEKAEHEERGNA